LDNSSINVYPNPAKGFINLSFNNILNISALTLFDITVRFVKDYHPLENRLNTGSLSAGQYILRIETEEGILTKKIQLE